MSEGSESKAKTSIVNQGGDWTNTLIEALSLVPQAQIYLTRDHSILHDERMEIDMLRQQNEALKSVLSKLEVIFGRKF